MKCNEHFILFWKYNETCVKIHRIADWDKSFLSLESSLTTDENKVACQSSFQTRYLKAIGNAVVDAFQVHSRWNDSKCALYGKSTFD